MVTLQLTDDEARVLALLLGQAYEEFSNHGCNDFDVQKELRLPHARARQVAYGLLEAMVKSGAADEEQLEGPQGVVLMDSQLFSHFKQRVRALL
jgi:hypothetical protein